MRILPPLLGLLLTFSVSAQVEELIVYPGDTGNDSLCSARDLLPIGIAWEQHTPARFPPVDSIWEPQFAIGLPENTLPQTLINLAHVDANGDSIINFLDAQVIAMNYDSIVTESVPLPPPYQPPVAAPVTYCPYIRLAFDRDTAFVRDTFYLDIFVEGFNGVVPEPDGVLGLSFSFDYDPIPVKDTLTAIFPDTVPGDLIFVHATQNRAMASRALPAGRIDFAGAGRGINLIRTDRYVGTVRYIVEDMIFRSTTELVFTIAIDPASVLFVNREEFFFAQDFCENLVDTVLLMDMGTPTREPTGAAPDWRVAPNPAREECRILADGPLPKRAWLHALDGRRLRRLDPREAVDLRGLPPGLYLLRLYGEGHTATLKVLHD